LIINAFYPANLSKDNILAIPSLFQIFQPGKNLFLTRVLPSPLNLLEISLSLSGFFGALRRPLSTHAKKIARLS